MHSNEGVTRRRVLTGVVALGGAVLLAPPNTAGAAGNTETFDTAPAAAALRRLVPDHYRQVSLRAIAGRGKDRFRVTGRAGQITVEGSSPAVLLTGFNTYLAQAAKADISWNGEQLNLPRTLPAPAEEITGTANVPHRFAFNDTNEGYTGAYRDWEAWEREIDVLALHGINEVLVY
ncbi:alpha-N-acetylglucosaminidase N-terminal domain-containing protein, partial [Streptomyces sp. 2MCAF27]